MSRGKRIETLAELITPAKVLADVGCDHGFIAEAALFRGVAEKIYITDISEKSLYKAIILLKPKIGTVVFPVCCFGLDGVEERVDEAVIAGLGGEEICSILSSPALCGRLPEKLVLNPMKNSEKTRRLVSALGYGITRDYTAKIGGVFYDFICASLSVCAAAYSETEFRWGRDNLAGGGDFIELLQDKIRRLSAFGSEEANKKISELSALMDEVSGKRI